MKALALAALTLLVVPVVYSQSGAGLTIQFIDVEGGQATLFTTPGGQSLLIDTGWAGHDFRDADRIAAAAHKAGLTRIDYVLITHFHADHVGGVSQLLARIPVGTFIDHGPNRETDNPGVVNGYNEFVNELATNPVKEIVAHPGTTLPIRGLSVHVISADGNLIAQPLPGAGAPNLFCNSSESRAADTTENARSLGVLITFGKLRIVDLGDLTWDKEMQLMCPINKLGEIDILIVSHHGWEQSSSPALVHALHPRIAVMDNGADKGGSIPVFKTLAASPGLETLWQVHYSNEAKDLNGPDKFIANPPGHDAGYGLTLMGTPNGSFAVRNDRTGVSQSYPAAR